MNGFTVFGIFAALEVNQLRGRYNGEQLVIEVADHQLPALPRSWESYARCGREANDGFQRIGKMPGTAPGDRWNHPVQLGQQRILRPRRAACRHGTVPGW